MDYHEHEVIWTSEKTRRFWDFHSRFPASRDNYFTARVGDALVHLVREKATLAGGCLLDYGAGGGHLTRELLSARLGPVHTCEFSPESAAAINDLFKTESLFKGCSNVSQLPTDYIDNQFDALFLVEALEHFTPEVCEPVLREISRVVKQGGLFIVTVPNDENLPQNMVLCPDCGAVFHRIQHVASFNQRKLMELVTGYGFETIYCEAVWLDDFRGRELRRWLKGIFKPFTRRYLPHLAYIGRKVASPATKGLTC